MLSPEQKKALAADVFHKLLAKHGGTEDAERLAAFVRRRIDRGHTDPAELVRTAESECADCFRDGMSPEAAARRAAELKAAGIV